MTYCFLINISKSFSEYHAERLVFSFIPIFSENEVELSLSDKVSYSSILRKTPFVSGSSAIVSMYCQMAYGNPVFVLVSPKVNHKNTTLVLIYSDINPENAVSVLIYSNINPENAIFVLIHSTAEYEKNFPE